MTTSLQTRPTHLGIFVTDAATGQPLKGLPLFAEVAAPPPIPIFPAQPRTLEPIRAALQDIDPAANGAVRDQVEAAVQQAIGQALDEVTLNELTQDPNRVGELFRMVFKTVLDATRVDRFAKIPASNLIPLLVAALRELASDFRLGLNSVATSVDVTWADPLGVLTTDHVGYASFDLTRLRPDVRNSLATAIEARRGGAALPLDVAVWIYPYGIAERFDALAQGRIAFDAIVARVPVKPLNQPMILNNIDGRALQNPGLTDWRLSPASFAASPKTLVGKDGCEELVPSNLALNQFLLRQVVRLTEVPANFGAPAGIKAAYVDDYKVSWYSLGHSLGEILYSLPLAPGESVKLAVIDWSWDSLTKRDETTKLSEEVLHQTHRDRTISETVKAGLREMQTGSSFMGGMATSAGASGSMGTGAMGVGGAIGNAWSLGGSTATSEGSRDLAAENVQRLNDSFTQASSSLRELNSTVVIQARQEEKESIQTRTFTNYNHSHTLTILYYEVLRHYRVTVEWVRRRPAVLVKIPEQVKALDEASLVKNRFLLEPALLDPTLKGGFDALEKRDAIAHHQALHGINPATPIAPPWWEGDVELEMFELGLWSKDSDLTDNEVVVYIITAPEHANSKLYELHYVYKGVSNAEGDYEAHNINSGERLENEWEQWTFLKLAGQDDSVTDKPSRKIFWRDIIGFQFERWGDTEWRIDALSIKGYDRFGFVVDFTGPRFDTDLYFGDDQPASQTFSAIKRPGPRPAAPAPVLGPDKSLTAEEAYQIKKLKDHMAAHLDHYARVLQLSTNTNNIAITFDGRPWMTGTMADHVDPTPLEVFGEYVAYPLAKQQAVDDALAVDLAAALNGDDPARRQAAADQLAAMPEADRLALLERIALASAKSERLITTPTRGVFAEGKLGHCNLSEEIDNTRFWKWEEHPIPFEAPGINPVTPITPTPQAVSATPTAFPQSLVNIVNPSPAPDPTGLTAALTAISTPNIFRDMSGRQEVADLLKKLSDNTIAIADAANQARGIQSKYGSASAAVAPTGNGGGGGIGGGAGAGSSGAKPATPKPTPSEQHDQLQIWRNAADKGDITPEQKQEYASRYLQNTSLSTGGDLPIGYATDGATGTELADLGAAIVRVIQHLDGALARIGTPLSATVRARLEAVRQEATLVAAGNQFAGEALNKALLEGTQAIDKQAADLRVKLAVPIVVAGVAVTAAEAALILAIGALIAILILITVSPEAREKARILKSKILDLAGEVIAGSTVEVDALRERVRRCREQPGVKSQGCLDALAEFDKASSEYNALRQEVMDVARRVVGDLVEIADAARLKALLDLIAELVAKMHTLADTVRTACGCAWG